ncbi:hypothetical protein, partial [Lysinibacillus xylanilyticus]|uniref:hypothetical protein n=1 Tax=Lysinibacillus xylanilyticus TaxID=582475 RepID=UPI003CFD137B
MLIVKCKSKCEEMLKVLKIVVGKSYPKGNNRGTKVKTITICENAFVTNFLLLPLRFRTKN